MQFEFEFQDLNGREVELSLFQQPFRVITHAETQLEVLDLQANTDLKGAFIDHGLIEFYRRLDDKSYPMILQNARFCICQFGGTYCCEQTFSVMKLNKSQAWTQLTDEHLGRNYESCYFSSTAELAEFGREKTIAKQWFH